MKEKFKKQNGITLIALIISIIVMLILAVVSINIIINQGIIGKSQQAANTHNIAAEKEAIELGYSEYRMDKIQNSRVSLAIEGASTIGDEITGWEIRFNESKNKYILKGDGTIEIRKITEDEETLEKYFLGDNRNGGIDIMTLLKEDGDNVIFTDNNVIMLDIINCDTDTDYLYVKYNNAVYRVILKIDETEKYLTQNVCLLYTPSGKEGEKISYSYDGTEENKEEWTILYDNGENIEIVSKNIMGDLYLGKEDDQAQGNSDEEKAIYSYNNAIKRLNNYCSSLITNDNKISVRSVGTNPVNSIIENKAMYKSEKLEEWNANYNGRLMESDNNWEQDYVRMLFWEIDDNSYYWLASRAITEYDSEINFSIRINKNGNDYLGYYNLLRVRDNGKIEFCSYISRGVRPIVKISSSFTE